MLHAYDSALESEQQMELSVCSESLLPRPSAFVTRRKMREMMNSVVAEQLVEHQ